MSLTAEAVAGGRYCGDAGPLCVSCASAAEPMTNGIRNAKCLMLDILKAGSLSLTEQTTHLSLLRTTPEGKKFMFFGSIPALVTPFSGNCVDEDSLRELIEWQIDEGSNGLVPCGTTGEAATLSMEEHRRVIEIAVKVAGGRLPVIAGCGSNNTVHAVELTKVAKEVGADAALHVPPYYNRPNQDGIFRHLSAVADQGIPIVLYNVPSRTITD